MSDFFWFSDEQWERVAPLLSTDLRGKPRVDDRRVLSRIVHALRCGGRWGDCPEHVYGPKKTFYNRFVRWSERGTVIPPRRNRKVQYDYDRAIYKLRNVIERMFCRLKDWRRLATRFDRNIKNFMGAVALAAAAIWWL